MNLMPEVIGVSEDPAKADDKYTATIRMRDTNTGKYVGPAYTVSAGTTGEIKAKIRPHLEAFRARQAREAQLRAVAQAALDELVTELGI